MGARKPVQLSRGQRIWALVRAGWQSKIGSTLRSPGMIVFMAGAAVSFDHIREVALTEGGYTWWQADLAPIMIDAMLIVAARYITRSQTWVGKITSLLAFVAGAVTTLWCNLLSAPDTVNGQLLAVIPAGTVIFTGIMLHWGEMKRAKVAVVAVRDAVEAKAARDAIKAHRLAQRAAGGSEPRHRATVAQPVTA